VSDITAYVQLMEASRRLNEVVTPDDVLAAIRDTVKGTIHASSVSLLWLDPVSGHGRYYLLWDAVTRLTPVEVDPLERRFVRQVMDGREALLLDDLSRNPGYEPHYSRAMGIEVGPMLVVPLIRAGELRGVLEVSRPPEGPPFDLAATRFVMAFGEDIVRALEGAFLVDELQRLSEENRRLYEISLDLGRALGLEALLGRILDQLARIVPHDAAGIYLLREDSDDLVWLESRGYPPGAGRELALKRGRGIVGQVADTGKPVVVDDVRNFTNYVQARAETRSELGVPIRDTEDETRIIGAFNLESDRVAAFNAADERRVAAFAGLAAVAIEREWARERREEHRRIDSELKLARRIQKAFLPRRTPRVPGLTVWGRQFPAIEMSGDYYDVIRISDEDYGLVIADVSGKGIPAALIMATLRAGLISEVRNVYGIATIITELNRFLTRGSDLGQFATAFYGVWNSRERSLTYVNAGHDPPLWVTPAGEARWLSGGGTILGVFPEATFVPQRVDLTPGDLLVLYTDGLTDSRPAERDELFGSERLEEVVVAHRHETPREVGEALMLAVHTHSGSGPRGDDQTLLVARVRPTE
jgi:sigma-B regulation protein RsbU (phosphoserine phosphatase)